MSWRSPAEPVDALFGEGIVGLLDALPDATAVLDRSGRVVAVNSAWRHFSMDNGGSAESTGAGVNYLEVCERSGRAGCADADIVAEGLRSVLRGESVESDLEYPCPSPAVGRWFMLRVTPIGTPVRGALVSHVNITRRKTAELESERHAAHDPLTGLGNRITLVEQLAHALSPRPTRPAGPDVAVLFIDLDGFKTINDTFGHAAGDEVLQETAARLSAVVRPQDTVARLGGDEFVVVAPRMLRSDAVSLVSRIEATVSEPLPVHGQDLRVGASIGLHLAAPGEEVDECLAFADAEMYARKRLRSEAEVARIELQG